MELIGETLLNYLKSKGFYEKLLDFQAVDIYNEEIRKKFPEFKASNAINIEQGVLKIITNNSVLSYEIFLNKQQIIEEINKIFSKKIIKDIVVRVGGPIYE